MKIIDAWMVTRLGVLLMYFVLAVPLAAAQEATGQQLRVYLDCPACDFDFVRTEIDYVDWMRDRADADLHILARSEATGGGGRQYSLDFLGLRRYVGKADTLTYVAGRDDTQDITRRGLLRTLQIGLMRYVADTPAASRIQFGLVAAPIGGAPLGPAVAVRDPWNAWVFSVSGNANANGESSRTFINVGSTLQANRLTARWKSNYMARGTYGRQRFSYAIAGGERDTTVVSITRSYSGNGLIVRSLSGHSSVGGRFSVGTSTFGNTELFINIEPAIEYNLYPYSQSTRQQMVFRYSAGMRSQRYREETVYLRMEETRPVHSFATGYSTRKPWGSLNVGIDAQQYLHDTGLYSIDFSGGTSTNLFRGLSANFSGSYSMVRDQISLARRNLTPEEVLLRQRQLATDFRYFTFFSLSYRFGSPVQNVVNPRFPNIGGGGVFF